MPCISVVDVTRAARFSRVALSVKVRKNLPGGKSALRRGPIRSNLSAACTYAPFRNHCTSTRLRKNCAGGRESELSKMHEFDRVLMVSRKVSTPGRRLLVRDRVSTHDSDCCGGGLVGACMRWYYSYRDLLLVVCGITAALYWLSCTASVIHCHSQMCAMRESA